MIYLASKSPRRQELLRLLGVEFEILTEDIDETMDAALSAKSEVARVSREKALAVEAGAGSIVVAADTIVVLGNRRMGKPANRADAAQMLRALSGKTHEVMTGLTLRQDERLLTQTVVTKITFRTLSEEEIAAYVATDEPLDKAGAYGIQGQAAIFVDRIDGDYYNVMGLPVATLAGLLRQLGVSVLGQPPAKEATP